MGHVILRMLSQEGPAGLKQDSICLNPITNKVISFEWEGEYGVFPKNVANIVVSHGLARYLTEKEAEAFEDAAKPKEEPVKTKKNKGDHDNNN